MEVQSATDCATAVRGRPREFCVDAALAAALRVFWTKGFEGASLDELTSAMGVSRPSLYAAFGNKEALFRKTLDLYDREKQAFMNAALSAPTARGVAERILTNALEVQAGASDPRGCLHVMTTVAGGGEMDALKTEVRTRRASSEAALVRRFEQAKADGDFDERFEPAGLARYLMALVLGMAVQAGAKTPKADLEKLIETALLVWPGR
ncbi:MAG: TetR/AcrR family transcriptional regulator [Caulobacteraceae bacterium]